MKILYAIQGTGNGHVCRAKEVIPKLQQLGEVDILLSGTQCDVQLPQEATYRFKGMSFVFGKNGGIDFPATFIQLSTQSMLKDIAALPVENYNLILNDFEPISAWACFRKKIPCISLSHQSAVINKRSPKPDKKDFLGKMVLKNYAPCSHSYGFHFQSYDKNIFTPVIRSEVRELTPSNQEHFSVYLPAYDDEKICKVLGLLPEVPWQVFSKHAKKHYQFKNITIRPIENSSFLQSMASCSGLLCGAGFETPSEGLFLNKKVAVIPMKSQYEQQCNAASLSHMGVPVFKSLKIKHVKKIADWVKSKEKIKVNYLDQTDEILKMIVKKHSRKNL